MTAWTSFPRGAVVGTSSLRRQSQLLNLRPDLKIETLRGNLDTRLNKLHDGQYDAIVLATAGLRRLEMTTPKMQVLGPPSFLPAVAQGALGIEYRKDAAEVIELLSFLHHEPSWVEVAGRTRLSYRAGWRLPGAHSRLGAALRRPRAADRVRGRCGRLPSHPHGGRRRCRGSLGRGYAIGKYGFVRRCPRDSGSRLPARTIDRK